MRRPSVFLDRREELDIGMTPMIDVVFLLLVFFVWTASFQVVEYTLPATMTQASGTQPQDAAPPPPEDDFERVVIRVSAGGAWRVNDQPATTPAQLRQRLDQIAAIHRETPVIVHPDPEAALGHAVDAYDAARAAGLQKVAFAAEESP